ncbi:MAG: hypothetical protein NVV70_16895 [Cellulomonas sp.]|nr:hypothetical protein [Cellulomonas sp.]MCR6649724.1 hypothetical protein [Cellulomonas sp.]
MTPTPRLTPQQQLARAAARLAAMGATISITAAPGFEDRPTGRVIDAAARAGIAAGDVPHAHTRRVAGCFRCEISGDER